MVRRFALIALCVCIGASGGCDRVTRPDLSDLYPPITVEFSGRVVNADTRNPVGNVRVGVGAVRFVTEVGASMQPAGWVLPTDSVTSREDGTFTLPLKLRTNWSSVELKLTDPGYEATRLRFDPGTAGTRAEIWAYPMLVIRPGESIDVRIDGATAYTCSMGGFVCRRVVVEASEGEPVKLDIVSPGTSAPMGLTADWWDEEPMPHLMIAPGAVAYVYGVGTARLTARR
jgi:hypothetical protein